MNSQTVFVSSNGKKYHAANCPVLKEDKKEITLDEAKKNGYKAHRQCKEKNIKSIEKQAAEERKTKPKP